MLKLMKIKVCNIVKLKDIKCYGEKTLYEFYDDDKKKLCLVLNNDMVIDINDFKIYYILSDNNDQVLDYDMEYVLSLEDFEISKEQEDILYMQANIALKYYNNLQNLKQQRKIISIDDYKRRKVTKK